MKKVELTNEQVLEIRNLRQNGMTLQNIAKFYPISWTQVARICRKEVWRHI
jgi:uncharacterized protein (DUF433 family)